MQDIFQQPDSTFERVRIFAIGIHREQTGLSKQTTAPIGWIQRNFAEVTSVDIGDSIEAGERAVDKGEVGVEEAVDGKVLLEDVRKEELRFCFDGGFEGVDIVGGEIFFGGWHGSDFVEFEPAFGEITDCRLVRCVDSCIDFGPEFTEAFRYSGL